MANRNSDPKKAFTLIELLVVISILALLMSILLPATGRAREQARNVVCASNFHQVGTIHNLYAADYGSWMPRFASHMDDYNKKRIGDRITTVIPYLMPVELFDYCEKTYSTEAKFWVCPSFNVNNKNKVNWFTDTNIGQLKEWQGNNFVPCYYLGIANLVGMINMSGTSPSTVEDSALKTTDRPEKLLAADLNIKWDADWGHPYSMVSHKVHKDGLTMPKGGNRLHVDGSVNWVNSNVMARNNQPISPSMPGKFNHWRGEPRDYYW